MGTMRRMMSRLWKDVDSFDGDDRVGFETKRFDGLCSGDMCRLGVCLLRQRDREGHR